MISARRAAVAAFVVAGALLMGGCTSAPSGSGDTVSVPASPTAGIAARHVAASSSAASSSAASRTSAAAVRHPTLSGAGLTPSLRKAPTDFPPYYHPSCQVPQSASTSKLCTYGDRTNPAKTIALVGDSVANEWLAALVDIAGRRHWKVVTDLHSRCPWSAAMTINSGQTVPYRSCHTWGQVVTADILKRIKPDVVVTSDRPVLGTPTHPTPGQASFAQIGAGMASYWHVMRRHHIPVVPIRESPEIGFNVPQCLAAHSRAQCTVSAARAITRNPPTVVGARLAGRAAHLVDMNGVICPHHICPPVAGHIVVYRDIHHLTATYVLSIAPQVERHLLATGVFGS